MDGRVRGPGGARRDGGVHGLAVCRADDRAVRWGRVSGRDGRDPRVAGSQAPRQERPPGALWLGELLAEGRLPEAWIAPEHVRQWRSRLHLRKALIDERTQWLLRIRSVLYHHGISAGASARIAAADGREFLKRLDLPADARERVTVALGMVDTLERQIHEIERGLRRLARRQAGCQALMTQFGVGELIALTLLTELGDVTRMSSSRKAVRFAGIEIGVHRSDQTARVGKLTRQGSSRLRWALYEAAQSATRPRSPTTPTTTRSKPADAPTPARR